MGQIQAELSVHLMIWHFKLTQEPYTECQGKSMDVTVIMMTVGNDNWEQESGMPSLPCSSKRCVNLSGLTGTT